MVGTTLVEIRDHVAALATRDGEYLVRCGRTGERPVPVAGLRFDTRPTARNAARAAEQYRTALRRYDPQVPHYDLIVSQDAGSACTGPERGAAPSRAGSRPATWTLSDPVVTGSGPDPERRRLLEFCHGAAAAVFESLTEAGHDAVERAVMDAYFELAEATPDPDDLCLCLVESMARELDERLAPAEQAAVLASAADRLPPVRTAATDRPVSASLTHLEACGLLADYARSPWALDHEGVATAVVVHLDGYALGPREGRLPVLPLTLDLSRRRLPRPPRSVQVGAVDGGWQLTVCVADAVDRTGLASASIEEPV